MSESAATYGTCRCGAPRIVEETSALVCSRDATHDQDELLRVYGGSEYPVPVVPGQVYRIGHADWARRRSVRLEATIRPPDKLRDDHLVDVIVSALRSWGLGVDVTSVEELGDYDPLGQD